MKYPSETYFGSPDQPGHLRDILAERIAAVPTGGAIDWVTYYFRDRKLAEALIRARQRGVKVTICLSARPRTSDANDAVIAMLSGKNGLDGGLRVISLPGIPAPPGRAWNMQVHEKLYCFSHPKPLAFVGSFNPSGDSPEQRPDIIRETGDQDRAYNVLVGLSDPVLVEALQKHARQFHRAPPGMFYRFSADANQPLTGTDTTVYFWPRTGSHPLMQFLQQFGHGTRVRIVASHIRANGAVNAMIALAGRGAELEILAEPTFRRVTAKVERALSAAGIRFSRVRHAEHAPMHLKFVLVEHNGRRWSVFGSFNWTRPSFWLNHEIAAISSDPGLFKAFAGQWDVLKQQLDE